METKHCTRCDTTKPVSAYYLNRGRADGLSGYCVDCQRAADNKSRLDARLRLIADLGGKCVTCGFSTPGALQIDHVNSDGKIDRIEHPNTNSAAFYAKVRANPDRYALLCANCNWIKRGEQGEVEGKRVYTRVEPQTKQEGEGRWSKAANARRGEARKAWVAANPEAEAERAARQAATVTGRRMIVDSTGTRRWSYPGDVDYPTERPEVRVSQAEHNRRVSEALKGRPASPQALVNLSKGHTPEVMAKARQASADARRGVARSEESKAKTSASLKAAYAEGRRKAGHTQETKDKIRAAKQIDGWSLTREVCVTCGLTDSPHKSRGVCTRCYYRERRQTQGVPARANRKHDNRSTVAPMSHYIDGVPLDQAPAPEPGSTVVVTDEAGAPLYTIETE